jgi:hypothetical protein
LAVFLFIAVYEIGMATAYYVIAQSMFPSAVRSWGTGFAVGMQAVATILVNFLYPIGLEAFSDAGGSQQRGLSTWFLIFGGIGIVSTAVCVRYLALCQQIAHSL